MGKEINLVSEKTLLKRNSKTFKETITKEEIDF